MYCFFKFHVQQFLILSIIWIHLHFLSLTLCYCLGHYILENGVAHM